jgi:hypothetical protein
MEKKFEVRVPGSEELIVRYRVRILFTQSGGALANLEETQSAHLHFEPSSPIGHFKEAVRVVHNLAASVDLDKEIAKHIDEFMHDEKTQREFPQYRVFGPIQGPGQSGAD